MNTLFSQAQGYSPEDVTKLLSAIHDASEAHAGQKRRDGTEVLGHPLRVAKNLLDLFGFVEIDMLLAAILHDTLEDTKLEEMEILKKYGLRVLGLVKELTDDPTLKRDEQKMVQLMKAPFYSPAGKKIKFADRYDNLMSIMNLPELSPREVDYINHSYNLLSGMNTQWSLSLRDVLVSKYSFLPKDVAFNEYASKVVNLLDEHVEDLAASLFPSTS